MYVDMINQPDLAKYDFSSVEAGEGEKKSDLQTKEETILDI